MKRIGRWLAETQAGRATFRLSVLALASLCVGGAVFAIIVNFGQESRITRVEHSACQKDAAGAECQQTKREAALAANLVTTCIPFWKAGYPCPKPGSTSAQRQVQRRGQADSDSAERLDSGPAPPAEGTTGGAEPQKGGSDKPPAPGKDGDSGKEAPTKAPEARSEPQTEPPPSDSAATAEPADIGNPSSTSEASPGLIGNPGGVVGEVACSASDAVNELAGVRVCSK